MGRGANEKSNKGWWAALGVIILIVLVNTCSSDPETSDSFRTGSVDAALDVSDEPEAAAGEVANLSSPNNIEVVRAAKHAGRIIGALGTEGAERYSRFCYEALGRSFSVDTLDRCYAFDHFAKRLIEENGGDAPERFSPLGIQLRWEFPDTFNSAERASLVERQSALEDAIALTTVAVIAPPPSRLAQEVQSTVQSPSAEAEEEVILSTEGASETDGVSAEETQIPELDY